MAAKLLFAAVAIGFVALASAGFLESPNHLAYKAKFAQTLIPGKSAWTDVMRNMMAFDISDGMDADADDLDAMEKTIEDLISKGDDPANKMAVQQLSGFIMNVLIPNREKQQKADQDELDSLRQAVHECRLHERVKRTPAVAQQLKDVEEHKEVYQDSIAKAGACQEVLEGKDMVKDAYCASIEDAAEVCHCDEKMVKHFGQRNRDCDSAPKINSENKECCDAFFLHEKKRADCLNAKTDAKYSEKQHGLIMGKLCEEYEQCWDKKSSAFNVFMETAQNREKTRSWTSIYRIKCLIDGFKDGKAKSCKDSKPEKVGVKYPEIPPMHDCNVEVQDE